MNRRSYQLYLACLCCFLFGNLNLVYADEPVPIELENIGVQEHLGAEISRNLEFTNEVGEKVRLEQYFDGKRPVLLALIYYRCPNLCNFLLNGLTDRLKELDWTVGKEFQIVAVTIDPKETHELATQKKQAYLKEYGREASAAQGWHFLTGSSQNIEKLASEVGFKYRYDADQDQYAHTAVLYVLTPQGKISRYLYGTQGRSNDLQNLRLALLEASQGTIGTWVDRLVLFCYHYDPEGRKYALFATNLMKMAAAVTVLLIPIALIILTKTRFFKKSRGS